MKINDTYDITIDGDVINTKTGRILKPFLAGSGYEYIRLGAGKKYTIHRLVASVYLPSPTEEGCVVDHINRNKLNNHASNLRWVSRSVNSANRTFEMKPRTNSSSEHHHINRIMTKGQKTATYAVRISTRTLKHFSTHKTIEDAIKNRDLIIENAQL